MKRDLLRKQILVLIFSIIYLNLSAQPFTEKTTIALDGVYTSSVAWGDYDNNGDLDILITGQDNSNAYVTLIYQNNNGVFTNINAGLPGVSLGSIAWGDFDNDGDLDILITGRTSAGPIAKIYRNDNGLFTDINAGLQGVDKSSVALGDYDNDGFLDILLTGYSSLGPVSKIYHNNGNSTFTEQSGINLTGVYNGSVAWGDYDNDGDLDILLTGELDASGSSLISKIYRNDSNNLFTEQTAISLIGVQYGSVAWGDYDNDGDLDIILTGRDASNNLVSSIYRNDNGVFTDINAGLTGVYLSSAAWGDFDNDGDLDIILTGRSSTGPISKIYRNDNGIFTDINAGLPGLDMSSVAWGDYDNDGDLDILITGSSDGLYSGTPFSKIFLNGAVNANTKPSTPANLQTSVSNGIVTFKWDKATDSKTPQPGLSYNLYVYESAQATYKCPPHAFRQTNAKNGKRLIARIGSIQWNSGGYFLKDLPYNKTYYWSVQAIDEGLLGSSFSTEKSFTVPLYRPNSQSDCISFTNILASQVTANWATGGGPKRVVFIKSLPAGSADPVDNTTYTINSTTPAGWKCVYNGSDNTALINGLTTNLTYSVQVCEYNGTPGSEKYLNTVAYQNPATVSTLFCEQTNISLPGSSASSVIWGDHDNDNNLDLLFSATSPLKIYAGPTFTQQTSIELDLPYGISSGSSAWGDYDNDGNLDLLITGYRYRSCTSIVLKNNGNKTFSVQTTLTGVSNSSVAWGDYNNDGYLDILLTGQTTDGLKVAKIYKNNGDRTFTEQTDIYLTGVSAGSVAWGDYDNDGDLDILMTGHDASGNTISKIYRNDSNNIFTEQTGISLRGVENGSVAWGDYNNDGNLDVLLTGQEANKNKIALIYRNNGNNTFTEQTGISLTGVSYSSAAWGDYDNDGDLDILLTGQDSEGTIISKIYRNNGDNSFTENTGVFMTGVFMSSVSFADYDNDGDLDILLTGRDAKSNYITKMYRNNCEKINKNPDQPTSFSYETINSKVLLKWNKVKTDETSSKSITYNVRVGRKSGANNFITSHSASNGFRKIVAMGNTGLDTSFLFKYHWDTLYYASVQAIDNSFKGGIFSNEVQIKISSAQPSDLLATNVNSTSLKLKWKRGNGEQCILFAKEGSTGSAVPQNLITYYANMKFAEGSQIGTTGWYCIYKGEADSVILNGLNPNKAYRIHVIEFQGINGSEIYAANVSSGNIGTFSTKLFDEQQAGLTGVGYSSCSWADYDNDGYLDIFLTGAVYTKVGNFTSWHPYTGIFRNNRDNTFSEQTGISLPWYDNGSFAWGDYNNDGYLDILITGFVAGIDPGHGVVSKIYKNNGDNTFTEQTTISLTGVENGSVAWGDYDNDGYLDILLTGLTSGSIDSKPVSKIYHNNGDNTFTEQTGVSLTAVYHGSVSWGDYNNDGNLDILITGITGDYLNPNPISKIYRNNGDNTFTEQTNISLTGVYYSSVGWGDYDNDGYLDILITGAAGDNQNPNPVSKIYRNNGDNTFTEQTNISLPAAYRSSCSWGDYDNDGKLDILLTGTSVSGNIFTKIYKNSGNNGFNELTDVTLTNLTNSSVAWGDYDNDGDLDVLLTGIDLNSTTFSKIYRNNLIMRSSAISPNKSPSAPSGLKSEITPYNTKLSWSPVENDETPSKTISYNLRYRFNNNTQWRFAPHSANNGFRRVASMGNLQLNNTFSLKNLPAGTYHWQVQAVDQGYKGGPWSVESSFDAKNVQSFFSADTVCLGLPTHFTDQSVATDGIAAWKWYFNDGSNSLSRNPSHIFLAGGVHNIKLVITSTGGIKDSLEKNIIVKPKPVANFTSTLACQGTETILVNQTNSTGLNITSWSWDYGDGKGSTFQNPGSHGYLAAGDYQLTLIANADNGCAGTVVKTVTVAAYPIAVISANAPLSFCDRDSVVLSVGGNPQYSYRWLLNNTGITNAITNNYVAKTTGNYSVEVINSKGSCKDTSSQVVITKLAKPATPVIVTENYQEGKCPGDNQIVLSVDQPVIEYSYQWKRNGAPISIVNGGNHIDILSAGDYSVSANLSGCSTESGIKTIIYENAPPKPLIYIHGPKVWYLACSIANAVEYKYKWYCNGNIIPAADKYIYVANQNLGNYYVTIENTKGCYSASDVIKIPTEKLSVEDSDPFAGLKIYPNPSSGQFVVEMENQAYGEFVISVSAQGGRQVLSTKFRKTNEHFLNNVDLSGLPKGLYIINLKTEKYVANGKLVVE